MLIFKPAELVEATSAEEAQIREAARQRTARFIAARDKAAKERPNPLAAARGQAVVILNSRDT